MLVVLKGSATSGWYAPPKGTHSGEQHRAVGSGKATKAGGGKGKAKPVDKPKIHPAHLAENIVRKPSTKLDVYVDERILEAGRELDMDPDDVEAAAMDNLNLVISESDVAIRVYPGHIDNILEDGELHNQHYSDILTSGGMMDPQFRAHAEANAFNVTEKSPPEAFPIYGYMNAQVGGYDPASSVGQYGSAELILKPSVHARTTVTVDDSLGNFDVGHVGASPMLNPTTLSLDDSVASTANGSFRYVEYIEAQIHGGVKLSDIAEVRFHVGREVGQFPEGFYDAQIAALTKAGIPAVYVEGD